MQYIRGVGRDAGPELMSAEPEDGEEGHRDRDPVDRDQQRALPHTHAQAAAHPSLPKPQYLYKMVDQNTLSTWGKYI